MVEAVIAVLIITSVFLVLFRLSHLLTGKIVLEHAAMRVARARAVGFNDFMCLKTARVATIPVAGRRLWPEGGEFDVSMELARLPVYMQTLTIPRSRGVLEYEGWARLSTRDTKDCRDVNLSYDMPIFDGSESLSVTGHAAIEDNAALYLTGGH